MHTINLRCIKLTRKLEISIGPYGSIERLWRTQDYQVNSALHPSAVAKSSTSFGWG